MDETYSEIIDIIGSIDIEMEQLIVQSTQHNLTLQTRISIIDRLKQLRRMKKQVKLNLLGFLFVMEMYKLN